MNISSKKKHEISLNINHYSKLLYNIREGTISPFTYQKHLFITKKIISKYKTSLPTMNYKMVFFAFTNNLILSKNVYS